MTVEALLTRLRDEPDAAPRASVPQAMRPAVELIARLSTERARLRDDLSRLRQELRGEDPALREELARVAAERDALRRELAALRREADELRGESAALRREADELRTAAARRPEPAPEPAPLGALLLRLERVALRLESSTHARRDADPAADERHTAITPRRAARAASDGAAPAGIGGPLAGLFKQNLALRSKAAAPAPAKEPAPETHPSATGKKPQGGGLLGALVKQNLQMRASSTPQGQVRRAA